MKTKLNIKDLTPRKDSMYRQGYYQLVNPSKYIGDVNKIIFRSSWEKRFATYCDLNEKILLWGSEPVQIPYFNPVDKVMKPYNVDFYVKVQTSAGDKEYIVEVKPSRQLQKPNSPVGRATEKKIVAYNTQLKTYLVNMSKFQAAKEYAAGRGWEFVIVTENFIF